MACQILNNHIHHLLRYGYKHLPIAITSVPTPLQPLPSLKPSPLIPAGHLHWKLPFVLTHLCVHGFLVEHSSISCQHSHENKIYIRHGLCLPTEVQETKLVTMRLRIITIYRRICYLGIHQDLAGMGSPQIPWSNCSDNQFRLMNCSNRYSPCRHMLWYLLLLHSCHHL